MTTFVVWFIGTLLMVALLAAVMYVFDGLNRMRAKNLNLRAAEAFLFEYGYWPTVAELREFVRPSDMRMLED